MNARGATPALLALMSAIAALLSDWLSTELFMRRDTTFHVASALSIHLAVVLATIAVARALLPARALVVSLRAGALVVSAAVVLSGLRSAVGSADAIGLVLRWSIAAAAVAAALTIALRAGDQMAGRLMRALTLASIAFVAVPFAMRLTTPPPRPWIEPAAQPAAGDNATLFLLLDELGHAAAGPLANDLREAGLNVRYDALDPADDGTLKVIPALFTGLPFPRARPCGMSMLCSGSSVLDFSRITVLRPDVDVTGLLVPYCDIRGLRSCFQLPLPHEFGSAYRSLMVFYLRRLSIPVPAALDAPPDPPALKRNLLVQQTAFIDRSRVWTDGGILYAHLPLPHPPGMDGKSTLDRDYADNIEQVRLQLRGWVARAASRFGRRFSIVITSDHPLRDYWCSAGVYSRDSCNPRASFRSTRVPLIVASPGPVSTFPISGNLDVFRILNDQAGAARF